MSQNTERFHKPGKQPDERRDFKEHGYINIYNLGESSIGLGTFEPGWKWSLDVKPIVKTESCQANHTGYCLAGELTVHMDDGSEFTIAAGEAYHIPPGHDAWVEGDKTCEMIDVTGANKYAKPS